MPIVTTQLSATPTPWIERFPIRHWDWHQDGSSHRIAYTVQGQGQPLVLIHGFGASIGHWRNNIPVLATAGYKVFALDLLGFGASDKAIVNYSLDLWQALLKDFWTAHIQAPAIFVGNSIGGLLALMMLADAPEMAAGGVLLNPAGGLNHRPEELPPPLRFVMGVFTQLVSSEWVGGFLFNQIRRKPRLRNTLRQVYHDQTAITDELIDILYQPSCDAGAQKVFASILTAPPGPKPTDLLPRLTQPLLVLWGEADPWTPIAGAKVYESAQRIKLVPIPNTGHCPHDERPDRINAEILNWLQETQWDTQL
jgi:pimeloyl-ACP methyl ester carboxylesterase